MKLIKVGAAVLNQTPLDWANNAANIVACIREARQEGVSVLCLPELAITGYGCEDAFHSPSVHETARQVLEDEILPETRGMIVAVGLPVFHQNAVFNAVCLAVHGRIAGFAAKRHLAGDGIHYEPRFFKPWPQGLRTALKRGGESHPIGDLYFDCGGIRIGFEICEDAWVSKRPGSDLALKGADIILNPSASHFAFGKSEVRKRFVAEGSRAFGVSYVYANLLGNEAGRAIYDGGALIATAGKLTAVGPRFSFANRRLTSAVVDVAVTRMNQARTASFRPNLEESDAHCVECDFSWPEAALRDQTLAAEPWETGSRVKEEEFSRAVALGLFDYMRKSRSNGFVVSLSGGADSSATACLAALMIRFAVRDLGLDAFLEKTRCPKPSQETGRQDSETGLTRQLLTCVYQATRHSSDATRNAARAVAESLGAEFFEFQIDDIVDQYVRIVETALNRPLTWERDDIALQNIQARVRAPGAWMLANIKNALLLATSDRSEASVGYATMDGDTCGGLSPIAGIDKDFLLKWLKWMETDGPRGIGRFETLCVVNAQAPTPELRPHEARQTAEGDLMPYDLLDAIERNAVRDKRSPLEVFRVVRESFGQYAPAQIARWIERYFTLWCRNQWKRERYAPSFHLDDENLDPKTWCRYPILSGGCQRELAILREAIATKTP